MKKSKFSEQQIIFALKQEEIGISISDICRKLGIKETTFYRWKKLYGGLLPSKVRHLRQLEDENQRLKRLVADLTLDRQMLQEVLSKKH
jgi:putative transposase